MRFADLDAVTVDGYGTLVRLVDPVPMLAGALAERGVEREPDIVRTAFAAEVEYYRPSALEGRDTASLTTLRQECTRVFLEAADADLDPASFVDAFVGSIVMEPEPGAIETLHSLRARGLELAVVSNWDIGLAEHLERLGLASLFSAVATTAEAGAPKPEPAVFRLALERLGVDAARALHVGDEPGDEEGAAAAGMRFAPAPLATAFGGWT
jgi:putative hydrolase of the HAD superfamily